MTGVGLPVAWHSNDTRRPTATDRLRGTDVKLGAATTPNGSMSACVLVTIVRRAKTAEPIEMPFGYPSFY